MKKILFACLIIALCIPFSSVYAGGWQKVGESKFKKSSSTVYSSGGDFKVCLVSGPTGNYTLWEVDKYLTPPMYSNHKVGTRKLSKGKCTIFRNIGKYVDDNDEKNRKAEFVLNKTMPGTAHVKFYD